MTREEAIKVVKKLEEVCYFTDTETEGLHTLIPELRESEDEKIRKHIVKFIDEQYPTHGNLKEEKDKMLAYLEKQKEQNLIMANSPQLKEQKPASTEDMPYITDEHFYEREPVDSFRYKLAKYMTQNSRKEESPDGYTYHISAETILEMAKEELLKRGVVQKPEGVQGDKGYPGLPGIEAVEGVVHHVMNTHYIVTNQKQLNARLRGIPEGTAVNILICEAKEE